MASLCRYDENVDALPYIDKEYFELQEQVEDLVREEMMTFAPRDYLSVLPPVPTLFENNPILQKELARVAQRQPMQSIDTTRYQVNPPVEDSQENEYAWIDSIKNAETQLEHQNLRLTNLELLNAYGSNSWILHNATLENRKQHLQTILQELKSEVEETNQNRREAQNEAEPKLRRLEYEWYETVQKNRAIEIACMQMEQQIESLEKTRPVGNGGVSSQTSIGGNDREEEEEGDEAFVELPPANQQDDDEDGDTEMQEARPSSAQPIPVESQPEIETPQPLKPIVEEPAPAPAPIDTSNETREKIRERVAKLKVNELKDELKALSLPCTGLKQALVQRLEEALIARASS